MNYCSSIRKTLVFYSLFYIVIIRLMQTVFSYVVLRTLINMDRNAPLNMTALGFDENDDIDQITMSQVATAVKVTP